MPRLWEHPAATDERDDSDACRCYGWSYKHCSAPAGVGIVAQRGRIVGSSPATPLGCNGWSCGHATLATSSWGKSGCARTWRPSPNPFCIAGRASAASGGPAVCTRFAERFRHQAVTTVAQALMLQAVVLLSVVVRLAFSQLRGSGGYRIQPGRPSTVVTVIGRRRIWKLCSTS